MSKICIRSQLKVFRYNHNILIGIASYFMLHLFVNLGGVSGLIPMTGVPLLLVSSGGSSTIAALIAIGIAQAIISKFNKEQLEKTDTQL